MLGFAGSAPTYRLCRLWLSVAKPNVYRVISFSFPSSPALLLLFNKREKRVAFGFPWPDYEFQSNRLADDTHISDAALSPLPLGEG